MSDTRTPSRGILTFALAALMLALVASDWPASDSPAHRKCRSARFFLPDFSDTDGDRALKGFPIGLRFGTGPTGRRIAARGGSPRDSSTT